MAAKLNQSPSLIVSRRDPLSSVSHHSLLCVPLWLLTDALLLHSSDRRETFFWVNATGLKQGEFSHIYTTTISIPMVAWKVLSELFALGSSPIHIHMTWPAAYPYTFLCDSESYDAYGSLGWSVTPQSKYGLQSVYGRTPQGTGSNPNQMMSSDNTILSKSPS